MSHSLSQIFHRAVEILLGLGQETPVVRSCEGVRWTDRDSTLKQPFYLFFTHPSGYRFDACEIFRVWPLVGAIVDQNFGRTVGDTSRIRRSLVAGEKHALILFVSKQMDACLGEVAAFGCFFFQHGKIVKCVVVLRVDGKASTVHGLCPLMVHGHRRR